SIFLFDLKRPSFRPDPGADQARRARSLKDGALAPPKRLSLNDRAPCYDRTIMRGAVLLELLFSSGIRCQQVQRRGPWLVRRSHHLISGSSAMACHSAACMDDRASRMGLSFTTADWRDQICDGFRQPHIRP